MGVRHNCGGSVGQHRPDKFRRGHQGAFQVNVGVQEARKHQLAGAVPLLPAEVGPYARNEALRNGDIRRQDLACNNIDIGRVFQHQVRRLPAHGRADHPPLPLRFPADFLLLALRHGITLLSVLPYYVSFSGRFVKAPIQRYRVKQEISNRV